MHGNRDKLIWLEALRLRYFKIKDTRGGNISQKCVQRQKSVCQLYICKTATAVQ